MTETPYRLRILHLSDLHECAAPPYTPESRQRQVELQAASRYRVLGPSSNIFPILQGIAHDYPIDLVCFTGDIADWGLPEEYELATRRIDALLQAANCSRDALYIVPGNHDINQSVNPETWKNLRSLCQQPNALNEISSAIASYDGYLRGADDGWRDKLLERESAFWSWVEHGMGQTKQLPRDSRHRYLGFHASFQKADIPFLIHIFGLDTAWFAGDDNDTGKLLLTKEQIDLLCCDPQGFPFPGFRIVLMHHPLYHLYDKRPSEQRLASAVDLSLHGHNHETQATITNDPDRKLLTLATGCLYVGDHYSNAFHLIDVYLNAEGRPDCYTITFWGWSDKGLHWHRTDANYQATSDGQLTIRVPSLNQISDSQAAGGVDLFGSTQWGKPSAIQTPVGVEIPNLNEAISHRRCPTATQVDTDVPTPTSPYQSIATAIEHVASEHVPDSVTLLEGMPQQAFQADRLARPEFPQTDSELPLNTENELLQHQPDLEKIFQTLQQGDMAQAGALLEEQRDEQNPLWLQLHADYLIRLGQIDKASSTLITATHLMSNPGLSQYAASVAYRAGRLEDAVQVLSDIVTTFPDIEEPRAQLATLLIEMRDYAGVVTHFEVLCELQPDSMAYQNNLAATLAHLFRYDEALSVYNALCAESKPPIIAILSRAILLRSLGRIEEAFHGLERFKDQYWDDSRFLSTYLDIAFSSGHDTATGPVLSHLQRLCDEGKIDPESFRAVSIDEFRQSVVSRNEADERLIQGVLDGKLPWLQSPVYMSWYIHTQHLDWISDDPIEHARCVVYATNGMKPATNIDDPHYYPLECPLAGSPVVVDVTALLTLDRLGLLDEVAQYFTRLLLPGIYLTQMLSDSNRLRSYQLSRITVAHELRDAYERHDIDLACEAMPLVDEYPHDEDERHHYSIRDVTDALLTEGRLSVQEEERLSHIIHQPSGVDTTHPVLRVGQAITIRLSTLESLSVAGVMQNCLNSFHIQLLPEDWEVVTRRIRAYAELDNVYVWHTGLCLRIQRDPHIEIAPLLLPPELQGREDDSRYCSLASVLLARDKQLPLLADDRACQSVMHYDSTIEQSAFGVPEVIIALLEDGRISADRAADAFLYLVHWRYRFLVIPATILTTLARRYRNTIGRPLRDIALYVQNCMRDPGLLIWSKESTSPSIAEVYYRIWVMHIAQFIIETWADQTFDDSQAETITKWAIAELIPCPPTCLSPIQQSTIAKRMPNALLGFALAKASTLLDEQTLERMNIAVRSMRDALGLDENDYVQMIAEDLYVLECK